MPRLNGELLKLGFELSEATVAKYMVRHRKPPSQTWRTFLANHMKGVVSSDFFVVPTVFFRVFFVCVILSHDRRRPFHLAGTQYPTPECVAHHLLEAFPWDGAPHYSLRLTMDLRVQWVHDWYACICVIADESSNKC